MALVLVIDDDPMLRELAVFALTEAGHHVMSAPSGDAGLAQVRVQKPDLIVCDVNMPGTDGFAVLEMLRRDPETSAVPVVMATALGERAHMRRGMTAGADDYLTKPYQPQELADAVAAVLARHDARHYSTIALMKERFVEALQRQEQLVAAKYEHLLGQELSARWDSQVDTQGQIDFRGGTLLLADLAGTMPPHGASEAEHLAAMLQAARDSLYLFGADVVLPYGADVLAIFGSSSDGHRAPAAERAVRAAFSLQSAVSAAVRGPAGGFAIALHRGDCTVLVVKDPLHGDSTATPVPSPALKEVGTLRQLATARQWGVAASLALAVALPDGLANHGARTAEGVELRRPD